MGQVEVSNSVVPAGSWTGKGKATTTEDVERNKIHWFKIPLECARSNLLEVMSDATREDWACLV